MKLRASAAIAVAALVAAAALAFENTYWYGSLKCTTKAKVVGERTVKQIVEPTGVYLSTTNSTFNMGPIAGGNLNGLIVKRNNTHYSAALPTDSEDLDDFTAWVEAKILAQTGIDVDLATVSMKGTFTLVKGFTLVKVNLKIKWSGTVATGEHAGKGASGSIAIKGTLPID